MRCTAEPGRNMAKAVQGVRDAAARGAQIVCLQELFRSQYFCQTEDHALLRAGRAGARALDRDAGPRWPGSSGVVIVASLFEKRAEGLYHNTAAIIDADGRYLGKYRKMHIPDDPAVLREVLLHSRRPGLPQPGTPGSAAIGVLVCWDQWYPEAARLTAMSGAQILFYPTAIGWLPGREGGARRAAAGRLGDDPAQPRHRQRRLRLRGEPGGARGAARAAGWSSGAAASSSDPGGRVLAKGGTGEEVLIATLRPGQGGREPDPLAVPARPPDRRLRRHHQAIPRLTAGVQ